jgi:nucleoside-diphosphate-sugar epimerase
LGQLDLAIDSGEEVFNMSAGNQLRDYLPVEIVAENFCLILNSPITQGVINFCSGTPITILDLVKKRRRERKSNILLNPGFYDIPKYEPINFWGSATKLNTLKKSI